MLDSTHSPLAAAAAENCVCEQSLIVDEDAGVLLVLAEVVAVVVLGLKKEENDAC